MSDEPDAVPADPTNPQEPKVDEQALKLQQERKKKEEDLKKMEEVLKGSLSGLAKTEDGTSFAFVKLNLAQKEIERLHNCLDKYIYVRHVDLSGNQISDVRPLAKLTSITNLNLSKNQIPSLQQFAGAFHNLQLLNISTNKLKQLIALDMPRLRRVNLNENQITSAASFTGHPNLELIEMRKNKLKKLKGLGNLPRLTQLYVAQNEITDIRGLQQLPILKKLHVRANKLKKFLKPFPYLPQLKHINLRENQIDNLQTISNLVGIHSFNLQANPLNQQLGENFRKEVILKYPDFKRVNKANVTKEQRQEWIKEFMEKMAERERERLQKQQEQRKKQEEERGGEPVKADDE